MSSHRRHAGSDAGFTIVETAAVSVVLIILVGAVGSMAARGREAQCFVEKQTAVTGATQDLLARIRTDVASSTRLFGSNAEGTGYLAGMDRGPWQGLKGERLAKVDGVGSFGKDKIAAQKTGNVLLFAMHDRTDVWDLAQNPSSPKFVHIDIYRIIAYYQRKVPMADLKADVEGLDLVRWVSQPLIDGNQVAAVVDSVQRQQLLAHLYLGTNPDHPQLPYPPARHLWKPGLAFDAAFEEVLSNGDMHPVTQEFKIPVDRRLARADHLEYRRMSIATNQAGSARGVGRFGVVSQGLDGFPHGFEVQIVGPAAARQVLIHLSVVSGGKAKHRAWLDLAGVVETRDL